MKVNWIAAQKYYLEDPSVSYKDVAERFGITERTVERHASKNMWASRRASVGDSSISRIEAEIIDRNGEINDKHARHYRNMQATAGKILVIANDTIQRKIDEKGLDNLTVYEPGFISPSRMKSLFDALKIAIEGERVAVGLPTSAERKPITAQSVSPLFAKVEPEKLFKLLEDTIAGIAE